MHIDHLRHLGHGQGPQVGNAFIEKVPLSMNNLLGNAAYRLLTLINALDHKSAGPDFVAHIVLHLRRRIGALHQTSILFTDAQVRHLLVIQGHHIAVLDLVHEHLRHHIGRRLGSKPPAGFGLKGGDIGRHRLHLFDRRLQGLGDDGILVTGQLSQVITDHGLGQRAHPAFALNLKQQTLP